MKDFRIVTYFASWKMDGMKKVRYDCLSQINYAFAIPTEDGEIRPLEHPEVAERLIREGHEHGVQVLISVGGWSYLDIPLEDTFIKATETPEKTEKLADAIAAMVEEYGFDGADMDWEHPRVKKGSHKQNEYLLELLAQKLHAKGKLLTAAVLGGRDAAGNDNLEDQNGCSISDAAMGHTDRALELLDFVHIMSYDGGDGPLHSSFEFAVACGDYWKNTRGVPAEKLILGVPFYGRPGGACYADMFSFDPQADQHDTCEVNGVTAHYNGIPTMRKKTRYAKENLGGIMIWEIAEDAYNPDKSLLKAIADEAAKD